MLLHRVRQFSVFIVVKSEIFERSFLEFLRTCFESCEIFSSSKNGKDAQRIQKIKMRAQADESETWRVEELSKCLQA